MFVTFIKQILYKSTQRNIALFTQLQLISSLHCGEKLKFCKYKDYITYGMVGLIGKINTLVIAIPTKEHGT